MKLRHSERMVVIPGYLTNNPYKLTGLDTFAEKYEAAKSSTSKDIVIIKKAFEESGIDEIETVTGVSGDVTFTPRISDEEARTIIEKLRDRPSESNCTLPGGYIYLSDLLSVPKILQSVRCIIANAFKGNKIDAVMTVAIKSVPLANAVTNILSISFAIVRRDLKITEGSAVFVSYVGGSSDRIEKMLLSRRSLKPNSRVLIVDGFPGGGGTVFDMVSLLKEFSSTLVGVAVFAENAQEKRDRMTYRSPLKASEIDVKNNHVKVETGNISD